MSDVNFDTLADRFGKNIYESTKGKIRIKLLLDDVLDNIPCVDLGGLRILDAGCGSAYFSSMLAGAPHRFELCDISTEMLNQARARFELLPGVDASFHQIPLQNMQEHLDGESDLVLAHAVLEWLDKPLDGFKSVVACVRSGGYLSLLFYNKFSLVYRHLIMGNYRRLNDRALNGFGGTLTPINPLDPYDVESWVADAGLTVVRKTGIRTFYDYQTLQTKQGRSFEDTYEMESRYARQQPFMYLGRYIHFLCHKPAS